MSLAARSSAVGLQCCGTRATSILCSDQTHTGRACRELCTSRHHVCAHLLRIRCPARRAHTTLRVTSRWLARSHQGQSLSQRVGSLGDLVPMPQTVPFSLLLCRGRLLASGVTVDPRARSRFGLLLLNACSLNAKRRTALCSMGGGRVSGGSGAFSVLLRFPEVGSFSILLSELGLRF